MALAMAVIILVTAPVVAGAVTELPQDHWTYRAVKHLSAKGVLTGVPVGVFKGERLLTRYEVAVLLARAMDRLGDRSAYVDDADMQIFEKLLMEFSADMQDVDVKVVTVSRYLELDELKARVAVLEEQQTVGQAGQGFISGGGAMFQLRGELELELVDTDGGGGNDVNGNARIEDPNPHFQIDKLSLQPVVNISDTLTFNAQIYFTEDEAFLNEFHVKFTGLRLLGSDPWMDVGLYERWQKEQYYRQSEGYSLPMTAFFRDDALTVTLGSQFGPVYWMASVGSGYELALKEVAEDSGYDQQMIHDNRATSGVNAQAEYGFTLGCEWQGLDVYGFYYRDKLSGTDITRLKEWLNSYTSDLDDKSRIGLGVQYELAGWKLDVLYVRAEDGDCERTGYAAEFSKYLVLKDSRWFTGVRPLLGFSTMDIDNRYDRDQDKPGSWDREKTILGVIWDLTANTRLKTEYYLNKEWTGGTRAINNNEACLQLEMKF